MSYVFAIGIYGVLFVCSCFLTYGFWKSKNGHLRKLLIALFASTAWRCFVEFTQYFWLMQGRQLLDWNTHRILANVPLVVTMFIFLVYVLERDNE